MPLLCPTCSRVNPVDAAYCYYDGRGLNKAALGGPLGSGTKPFPMPFSFADGQGCTTFNQLVLASDQRWIEARTYLVNGIWKTFFTAIGRMDLAILAQQSAAHPDPDLGLCQLLERLPADVEALHPPQLALPAPEEDLGTLEPGADYKVSLVIANEGMLLLRGSATTSCDWLLLGDGQGSTSKLFQTRDSYTLTVRVVGGKLRAAKKPLEGQIVIDTNGGRQTFVVRAHVPIRPFPAGPNGKNVLTGATSSREIALKAKAHPHEAAALFEQGAVKAWYERNGWAYPIRGTQAAGKSALQQFFEALGLTKPPRLEIDTQQIETVVEVGQQVTKKVTLRTAESKFVHAEAHSNQEWIKALPGVSHGNSFTIPLRVEAPPCVGETLRATVTFRGNGQQQFVVPIALTVTPRTPSEEEVNRSRLRLLWAVGGGAVLLALIVAVVLVLRHRRAREEKPLDPGSTANANGPTQPGPQDQPVAQVKHWWDAIPNTHLTKAVLALKDAARDQRPIFELIEGTSESDRRTGYEQLAAKLPELAAKAAVRQPLGVLVTECCVFEPTEFNITPLLRGLIQQLPKEDSPFPPDDKGEAIERAVFWLQIACEVIANKGARLDRSRSLASDLGNVFGSILDPNVPPQEFKEQAEKALAEQCYRSLLPTAEKSVEQALALRDVLLARFPQYLRPEQRDPEDVKLLALGVRNKELWPRLEPIFKTCVDSNSIPVGFKLIDLYEKADKELAPKMETLLAAKWKVAGVAELARSDKAGAIRASMAARARAAKIAPAERIKQLRELLAKSPLRAGKPKEPPPADNLLQDSVRLAHVSTMACILFNKKAARERFDELMGQNPSIEPEKVVEEKKVEDKPQKPGDKEVIDVGNNNWTIQEELNDKSEMDPRRGTYRKVYRVRLKAGEIYIMTMSSKDLTPYLRVETMAGKMLAHERGASARITFTPPAERVYRLIASSVDRKAVGSFSLQISRQQVVQFGFRPVFRPGFRPVLRPVPVLGPMTNPVQGGTPNAVEETVPQLNPNDLADLANKQSNVRIAAFKNLARGLPANLAYRHAKKIAAYLLLTPWMPLDAELDGVKDQLPALAKCRPLLEALADVLANETRLTQRRTEVVVGGLLDKPLRFAPEDDWPSACRKMLLHRALELADRADGKTTDRKTDKAADRTASFLRDLYKEQGFAFALDTQDFQEQTRPTAVLERLVKHVAAQAAAGKLTPAEKAYLEQIDRPLRAARFVADNDLAYMVLLQRIWLKVLGLALKDRLPEPAQKKVLALQADLDKKDRTASNLLDQLRSGEENILRVWALAHDLKLQ